MPAECESGNVPNEIFVPTILECDSLTDEDRLETKDNRKFYINNKTVWITDSGDLYRPHKLVKGIYNEKNTPTLIWKMKILAQSTQVQMILLGTNH